MVEISFSTSFKKAFKKAAKNKAIETRFWQKIELFTQDPFHPQLKTHKLSGKLKNLWSYSVDYDLRVIFYFENKSKVVFIDIATHNEVY
jgi:addiction module RelE/StbE family toxin